MIKYYFAEALKSIFRAKLSSLFTVVAICFAIGFTLISSSLVFLSNQINNKVKGRVVIDVFLKDSVTRAEIKSVRRSILKDSIVSSAKFVSSKDARENFIRETGEDFMSVLDVNPLPSSFAVKFVPQLITQESISKQIKRLRKLESVTDVVYDSEFVMKVIMFADSAKIGIYIFSALLILLSVYLVYSTNKLIFHSKSEQYATMKLVGAKLSAIKLPIILNGIFLGLISAVICMALFITAGYFLQKLNYDVYFVSSYYFVNLIILILGISFGLIGSIISTKNISLKIETV